LMLADNLNLDVEKIISDKIKLNEKKYPVQESYSNKEKYTELNKEK